jgi:hypothetical protein
LGLSKDENKIPVLSFERVGDQLTDERDPKAIKRLTAAREYLAGLSSYKIEENADGLRRFKISCSPRLCRGEHVKPFEKTEREMLEQRQRLRFYDIEERFYRSFICRVAELIPPQRSPCSLVCELFYDTLLDRLEGFLSYSVITCKLS